LAFFYADWRLHAASGELLKFERKYGAANRRCWPGTMTQAAVMRCPRGRLIMVDGEAQVEASRKHAVNKESESCCDEGNVRKKRDHFLLRMADH
jgi:hypothetical protein